MVVTVTVPPILQLTNFPTVVLTLFVAVAAGGISSPEIQGILLSHSIMSTAEPYDLNFCFPAPDVLENDRVKLVPFIVRLHPSEAAQ